MNGKNRRTRGCFSRVSTGFNSIITNNSNNNTIIKKYNLPIFNTKLKNNCSVSQNNLLQYFENFGHFNIKENYKSEIINNIWTQTNTERRIIQLRQSDFNKGTIRITIPGIYVLQENIIFNPNPGNDFFPTTQQIETSQYPMGFCGAYHLGFFAAITIETNGVILDLNNFTISQSPLHTLQQRFYSHIELASSPFIPKQGPGCFSSDNSSDKTKTFYKAAGSTLIRNGYLGKSSHHGIHGNSMKHIVLDTLNISDFEVAGIALNGTELGVLNNIIIKNVSNDIPVVSSYSQARFIRNFLLKIPAHRDSEINIDGNIDAYENISKNLNDQLKKAKESIIDGIEDIPKLFKNNTGLYDGNVYGMVLNKKGVVINGFIRERTDAIGNKNIHLQDITISEIRSNPIEIIGLNSVPEEEGAYGAKMQAGPAGDILHISNIQTPDGKYSRNALADAQILIAKYNNPKIGTTSIHQKIVDWVETSSNLSVVMSDNGFYFVDGADSMGHTMKGNIGLFISAGLDITGNNININNIKNKGTDVGTSSLITSTPKMQGATSNGILFTGSTNINISNSKVTSIISDSGTQYQHLLYNISGTNIKFNNDNVIKV